MGEDSTHASSFNSIDMAAAIESIKTYLSHYLSAGQTVHLDGIGSFQLSLGLKKMAGADEKVSARQVEVKGITFRPAASFMTQVTKDMHIFITALRLIRSFFAKNTKMRPFSRSFLPIFVDSLFRHPIQSHISIG